MRSLLDRGWFILVVPALVGGQTFTASQPSGATPNSSFQSLTDKSFVTGPRLQWALPFNTQQHTYMFGPKWKLLDRNRFTLDVWAPEEWRSDSRSSTRSYYPQMQHRLS